MFLNKIYFLIIGYPEWDVGSMKYQSLVFNYFSKKRGNVYIYGNSRIQKKFMLNRFFRLLSGIFHAIRIPRGSMLVMNNSFFLEYFIPLVINKFWKKHVYFLIIHDLVQVSRPTYLRRVLENYFIRNTNGITISEAMKKELVDLKLKSDDMKVVSPGLDVNLESVPPKKIFPSIPKILYVGSVERRKGLLYLIESLKYLCNEQFELNLIGRIAQQDYAEHLKQIIQNNHLEGKVFFHGRVSSKELEEYYLNSTVFVFPSLYEGYGMATSEALAYGLPVIASRISATQELVKDGQEGFLVEPKNSVQMGAALKKLINNPILLEKFSRNALIKAKTFPTWEETSEKIWKIISKID